MNNSPRIILGQVNEIDPRNGDAIPATPECACEVGGLRMAGDRRYRRSVWVWRETGCGAASVMDEELLRVHEAWRLGNSKIS